MNTSIIVILLLLLGFRLFYLSLRSGEDIERISRDLHRQGATKVKVIRRRWSGGGSHQVYDVTYVDRTHRLRRRRCKVYFGPFSGGEINWSEQPED